MIRIEALVYFVDLKEYQDASHSNAKRLGRTRLHHGQTKVMRLASHGMTEEQSVEVK